MAVIKALTPEIIRDEYGEILYAIYRFRREKNSGRTIAFAQVTEWMVLTFLHAYQKRIKRLLVIAKSPQREHYALNELTGHALITYQLFKDRRLAYVNQNARADRVRYVNGIVEDFGCYTIKSFSDETKALEWLLEDVNE